MLTLSNLRSQTIGQMLDQTARLYRRNFWTFLGIIALVQVPIMALSLLNVVNTFGGLFALLQNPLATPDVALGNPILIQLISTIVSIASIFLTQFSSAALCLAVVHALLGEKLSIIDAYRKMWHRWQSLSGMAVLIFVIGGALGIGIFFGFLLFVIPGIAALGMLMLFSFVTVPFIVPVLMLEQGSAWDSIQRAWNMVRRRMWPLVGLMTANALFAFALIAGIQVVIFTIFGVTIADTLTGETLDETILSSAAVAIAFSTLASILVLPVQQSLATVAYLDLRVRLEGLDLALMVTPPETPFLDALAAAPREPNSPNWFSRTEFGRFTLLGLIPFGLLLLYFGLIFTLAFAFAGI